jgi:hypothetical protein
MHSEEFDSPPGRKNEAMHVLVHDIVFYSHVLIK